MIRINLLGVAAPKPAPPPGAPAPAAMLVGIAAVISLVVSGLGVGGTYYVWSRDLSRAKDEELKELRRQAELKDVAAKNLQYQAQIRELETRTNTIESLQNSRLGPTDLMNRLADAVNRTRDVWLSDVTPSGNRVLMNGQAFSVDSIAHFMASLAGTGSFQDVHLQEYAQTAPTTFRFKVDCIYKLPAPTTTGPPAAPAGQRRTGM